MRATSSRTVIPSLISSIELSLDQNLRLRDPAATLDDLREAVATIEELERTTRRVFGGAHPFTTWIELNLQKSRAMLAAREGDGVSSVCDGVAAMTPRGT